MACFGTCIFHVFSVLANTKSSISPDITRFIDIFTYNLLAQSATFLAIVLHKGLIVLMSTIALRLPISTIIACSYDVFTIWINCCCRHCSCREIGIQTLAIITVSSVDILSTTVPTIVITISIVVDVITIAVSLPSWFHTSRINGTSSGSG